MITGSSFNFFSIILMKFAKALKKIDPKILVLIGIVIVLAVLLANEKKHTCDCPVCKECECEKKKVTFAEKTDLISSQSVGPAA